MQLLGPIRTLVGIDMSSDPLVHVAELGVTKTTVSWNLIPLALFGSAWILEMNSLQVVFISVTPRENPQGMAAMVAVGSVLEGAPVLAVVSAHLLPVTFEVTKQVVWPGKPPMAQLTHMGTRGWLQMSRLVSGQVREEEVAFRTLALFAGLPILFVGLLL